MSEEGNSYRQIFKALSFFGGVQVLVIILGILRNKVVALYMGPRGIGEIGLYTTTITLMVALVSFGIGSSGVKIISESFHKEDKSEFGKNVFVFTRLSFYLGILGSVLTLFLSPILSLWTFGSYDYTISFAFLSITVFLIIADTGNLVLLQGVMNLKDQGKASVFGTLFGSLISIPLYIIFKEKAIVPSLMILFLGNVLASFYFSKKIYTKSEKVKLSEFKERSKEIIRLGLAMTVSYILVIAVSYVSRLYISQEGGIQEVGMYQAAWAIVNGYVGLIFTAMAKDYFPRLSSVNSDNSKICDMANKQIELGLLIISPIILIFLIFIDKIVYILYSSEFYLIKNMMIWSLLGMFFKLLSWSISYIFLAKGLSRQFVIYEVVINVLTVFFNILFYKNFKLEGLGFAFCAINLVYLLIVFYMARYSFNFFFSKETKILFSINLIICLALSLLLRFSYYFQSYLVYSIFIFGVLTIFYISIKGLNERLNLLKLFKK